MKTITRERKLDSRGYPVTGHINAGILPVYCQHITGIVPLQVKSTALKVSRSLYCFTTSVSHAVEKYFPRLWGTGISDAIFPNMEPRQHIALHNTLQTPKYVHNEFMCICILYIRRSIY